LDLVPGEGIIRGLKFRVDEDSVMRRLQMRGGRLNDSGKLARILKVTLALGERIIEPAAVYATFGMEPPTGAMVHLESARLSLKSRDVASLLSSCDRATLLAATIGGPITSETERLMSERRMTEAMILDAFGSEAVEALVDILCSRLEREAEGAGIAPTRRFSPGYGDWDLNVQPDLLRAVGADRIGIRANEAFILVPEKSVTAIMGWSGKRRTG